MNSKNLCQTQAFYKSSLSNSMFKTKRHSLITAVPFHLSRYSLCLRKLCSHCLIYHLDFLKSAEMLKFFGNISIARHAVQAM